MSKAKFAAAKELIDEKKYDEARAILKTIDHPTAREWEAKLDKIAPSMIEPSQPIENHYNYNVIRVVAIAFIVVVIIVLILRQVQQTALDIVGSDPEIANSIIATTNHQLAINPSATITVYLTRTPLPTITDTPLPPATSTQIRAPLGTKANPYPAGTPGAVRDGRVQVDKFERNQDATLKKINQFNDDPPAGGEWVIINVTFYCDLDSSQTCNVGMMNLELTGRLGTVYTKQYVVLNHHFEGEAFGGGQISGELAFAVNSKDSDFIFIVNDLGSRTFFGTETAENSAATDVALTPSATPANTLVPSITPTATVTPTSTQIPPSATPLRMAFSGTNAKVLGPLDIPQGSYRAVFKTTGYGSVVISASKGECGADMSGFTVPNLFLVLAGQANNGAEAILKSTGCTTLIQISNVTQAWTLSIETVG